MVVVFVVWWQPRGFAHRVFRKFWVFKCSKTRIDKRHISEETEGEVVLEKARTGT